MNSIAAGSYRSVLLALVLLMLVLHGLFFVGYLVSDDWLYLSQAQRYLSGDFSLPQTHWGFRYTIVLPLTFAGLLVDYSERVLALFPLLYWIAILFVMVWFMRHVAGRQQALYAGLLVATLPLFVVQSSIAGVDITEGFFLFAGFLVFFVADTAAQARCRDYFAAGLLVGLALLTRETAYGFLIVLGLFFVLGGFRRWQFYLVGLLGMLSVLSLEWIYYIAFDQGPFYRLETISQSHGTIGIKSGDFAAGTGNVSDNRLFGPLLAVLLNQEFALLYWVAIGAAAYLYKAGDPSHRVLLRYVAIAFVVYFLWIGYSGAIRPLPRYYAFPSLLAMIPIALMLVRLSRPWVRYIILFSLLSTNLLALSLENINPRFAPRVVSEFAMERGDLIVTDERTAWQAREFVRLAGGDGVVVDQRPVDKPFVFAAVEGLNPPEEIRPLLKPDLLIAQRQPPKLMIGHLLDLSGVRYVIPASLYHYLAIRNPAVRFYRLTAPAS